MKKYLIRHEVVVEADNTKEALELFFDSPMTDGVTKCMRIFESKVVISTDDFNIYTAENENQNNHTR